ncbi:MAG: hypothetical protein WC792_01620 [Candidatus Micrarchaeia archaeon]
MGKKAAIIYGLIGLLFLLMPISSLTNKVGFDAEKYAAQQVRDQFVYGTFLLFALFIALAFCAFVAGGIGITAAGLGALGITKIATPLNKLHVGLNRILNNAEILNYVTGSTRFLFWLVALWLVAICLFELGTAQLSNPTPFVNIVYDKFNFFALAIIFFSTALTETGFPSFNNTPRVFESPRFRD